MATPITLSSLYVELYGEEPEAGIPPRKTSSPEFRDYACLLECNLESMFFQPAQQASDWVSWFKSAPNTNVLNKLTLYVNELVGCTYYHADILEATKENLINKALTALAHKLLDLSKQKPELKYLLKALSNHDDKLEVRIDWEDVYGKGHLPPYLQQSKVQTPAVSEDRQPLLPTAPAKKHN